MKEFQSRKPIMPKQQHEPRKKGQKKPQPTIAIAQPEMKMDGFKHTQKSVNRKNRLLNRAYTKQVEAHSQSNRKSSIRPTSFGRVPPQAVEDSDELDSQHDDDVEVPMNEEIKHDDAEFQDQ
jgi:hypothetical protein